MAQDSGGHTGEPKQTTNSNISVFRYAGAAGGCSGGQKASHNSLVEILHHTPLTDLHNSPEPNAGIPKNNMSIHTAMMDKHTGWQIRCITIPE